MGYTDVSFLAILRPYALRDMKSSGILASLTAAQAFIESNKGNSGLTQKANNLFGIKGTYNGQSVTMPTTEYYNGVPCKVKAAFRKYPSWQESVNDHSAMFNRMNRYANLRGCTDYVQACRNIAADGYATSPTYAQTLINCIRKYDLQAWDEHVLSGGAIESYTQPVTVHTTLQPAASDTFADTSVYPVLKKGSKGKYVRSWQRFLNINGYSCGKVDGIFGDNTREAVMQFQVSRGLKCDGIIGAKTWRACLGS